VGLALQATNDYVVTAASDGAWAFHDIKTANCLAHVKHPDSSTGFTCVSFHPDGLIFGTGSANNFVRIWDIKTQQNVVTFEGHEGSITDLAFSENGFYLATASVDGAVKLCDLRKLKNIHTHNFGKGSPVECVAFDPSGTFLAAGGADIKIFASKTFELVKTFPEHKGGLATDIQWSPDCSFLASSSQDRNLRFLGKA